MTAKKNLEVPPNEARTRRELAERQRRRLAALQLFLKDGSVAVNEVLRNDKVYLQGVPLAWLLRALPTIGKRRAAWIIETLRVPAGVLLGDFDMLRREELIMLLARHFPSVPLSEMTPQQNRERVQALQHRRYVRRIAP